MTEICTAADIRKTVTQKVIREVVGKGDNQALLFFLQIEGQRTYKEGVQIIEDSLNVYLNDIETEAYTADLEEGSITFTQAPGTDVPITASFQISLIKQVDDERIAELITDSLAFIEQQTGYRFQETDVIESVDEFSIPITSRYGKGYAPAYHYTVENTPLLAITSVVIDGIEISDENYRIEDAKFPDTIHLLEDTERTFSDGNAVITYSFGYDIAATHDRVLMIAQQARQLCILLTLLSAAGVNIYNLAWGKTGFVNFGSYSVDRGTYLTPGSEQIKKWEERAKQILENLPHKIAVV
ncbi:TPA_asm: hypothetical protein vir519_00025 [Caudoviricetes sp. vir519]|nr:TPA_asm: hypothetical protein vir519_00025 [Caudoviricetes sp. vir519]